MINNEHETTHINIILKDNAKLLANANISILTTDWGRLTIKGFQIWKSDRFNDRLNDKINITPPSRPSYGKYYPVVFFENHNSWYNLELDIYMAYTKKLEEQKKATVEEETEEINVPF